MNKTSLAQYVAKVAESIQSPSDIRGEAMNDGTPPPTSPPPPNSPPPTLNEAPRARTAAAERARQLAEVDTWAQNSQFPTFVRYLTAVRALPQAIAQKIADNDTLDESEKLAIRTAANRYSARFGTTNAPITDPVADFATRQIPSPANRENLQNNGYFYDAGGGHVMWYNPQDPNHRVGTQFHNTNAAKGTFDSRNQHVLAQKFLRDGSWGMVNRARYNPMAFQQMQQGLAAWRETMDRARAEAAFFPAMQEQLAPLPDFSKIRTAGQMFGGGQGVAPSRQNAMDTRLRAADLRPGDGATAPQLAQRALVYMQALRASRATDAVRQFYAGLAPEVKKAMGVMQRKNPAQYGQVPESAPAAPASPYSMVHIPVRPPTITPPVGSPATQQSYTARATERSRPEREIRQGVNQRELGRRFMQSPWAIQHSPPRSDADFTKMEQWYRARTARPFPRIVA